MASSLNASNSGSGGLISTADASGVLQLQTASTTAVTIDTSQNVGIGTTSPAYKIDINNAASRLGDTTGGFWQLGASSTAAQNFHIGTVASDSTLRFYNGNYGSGTERMRIDSTGNLCVGTTSSTSRSGSTARICAVAGSSQDGILFQSPSNSYYAAASHVTTTSGTRYHIGFGDGATFTERGNISTNGTGTTYNTNSDYRLKENITPMQNALNVVQQLKPCTYIWKETGDIGQGFIAHELQAVVPDCVNGEKDAVDEEGKPVYQGIDTSFLVATLTAAIQEMKAIIDAQSARIDALENK